MPNNVFGYRTKHKVFQPAAAMRTQNDEIDAAVENDARHYVAHYPPMQALTVTNLFHSRVVGDTCEFALSQLILVVDVGVRRTQWANHRYWTNNMHEVENGSEMPRDRAGIRERRPGAGRKISREEYVAYAS